MITRADEFAEEEIKKALQEGKTVDHMQMIRTETLLVVFSEKNKE